MIAIPESLEQARANIQEALEDHRDPDYVDELFDKFAPTDPKKFEEFHFLFKEIMDEQWSQAYNHREFMSGAEDPDDEDSDDDLSDFELLDEEEDLDEEEEINPLEE